MFGKSLLEMGFASLAASAQEDKRAAVFAANQQAVNAIKEHAATFESVEQLQVKPNINGESESQKPLPLIKGESYNVDLTQMRGPGGRMLDSLIRQWCNKYNIEVNSSSLEQASFTPVVTTVAGQHASSDTQCQETTSGELVPVFQNPDYDKARVLAVSYTADGATGIREDFLLVHPKTSMTCSGRKTGTASAIQAIEIPNLLAQEMADTNASLFEQLQKSSSFMIHMEYELIKPQRYYYESSSRGGNDEYVSKGIRAMGGEPVAKGGGDGSRGISTYSVMTQGSATRDNSTSVSEEGTRKLKSVKIYCLGAIVVNTNAQALLPSQCNNVVEMMKLRATELGNFYKQYKLYTYGTFINDLNSHLVQYKIDVHKTHIFEHSILRMAGMSELPSESHFNGTSKPGYAVVKVGLSYDTMQDVVNNLNKKYGNGFCSYEGDLRNGDVRALSIPLSQVAKHLDEIKKNMDAILSQRRQLRAYQNYQQGKRSSYNTVVTKFDTILNLAGISIYESDGAECLVLRMFGYEGGFSSARFTEGKGFLGNMVDTDFYIDIPEGDARKLVDKINERFSKSNEEPVARFIAANARVADKGYINFSHFSIESEVILSEEFQKLAKETLVNIPTSDRMLTQFRINSFKESGYFTKTINNFLSEYRVTTTSDIVELSILNSVGFKDIPSACSYDGSKRSNHLTLLLGLSSGSMQRLVTLLKDRFGNDFCFYDEYSSNRDRAALSIPMEQVAKHLPAIQTSIRSILQNEKNLVAYQNYSKEIDSSRSYSSITRNLNDILYPYGINSRSDGVEMVVLRMFGCEEPLKVARFTPPNDYIGKMMETHFYLNISREAAEKVVEKINQTLKSQYGLAAQFVRPDAVVEGKGSVELREISINNDVLLSSEFQSLFKTTIANLLEEEPLMVEKYRIDSGRLTMSSQQGATILRSIADRLEDKMNVDTANVNSVENPTAEKTQEATLAKDHFAKKLNKFADVLTTPHTQKERRAASYETRRGIAFFEYQQRTPQELEVFKRGDKKQIKEVQEQLSLTMKP